jgi:hypothetical protein
VAASGAGGADLGEGRQLVGWRDAALEVEGMLAAHLIEHAAIDLLVAAKPSDGCSGAIGAHRDPVGRFDIFLECQDFLLGRAVATLATAGVRDLCTGMDRTSLHQRCRDLLVHLANAPERQFGSKDIARRFRWNLAEVLAALDALVRFGYIEQVKTPLTLDSSSGRLFQHASLA